MCGVVVWKEPAEWSGIFRTEGDSWWTSKTLRVFSYILPVTSHISLQKIKYNNQEESRMSKRKVEGNSVKLRAQLWEPVQKCHGWERSDIRTCLGSARPAGLVTNNLLWCQARSWYYLPLHFVEITHPTEGKLKYHICHRDLSKLAHS